MTTNTPKAKQRKGTHWAMRLMDWALRNAMYLAMAVIIGAAGVAVYAGALYSATVFGFHGWSAYSFAALPDALMVVCTALQRRKNIEAAQRQAAQTWMRVGLGFSMLTNMIAALLTAAPGGRFFEQTSTDELWMQWFKLIGTLVYHGVVVLMLWGATETITKRSARMTSIQRQKPSATTTSAKPSTARAPRNAKGGKASAPTVAPIQVPLQLAPPAQTLDRLRRGQLVMSDLK